MNYCAVNEAFDNSLNQKINEYDRNNNINNVKNKNDIVPPDTFDNYSDIDIQNHFSNNINQYHTMVPAYFTAQGDYNTKGPYYVSGATGGTSINELKNNTHDDYDSLSLLDSDLSEESTLNVKPKKINHEYCINKIIKGFIEDQDTLSLASSQNDEEYKHVKTCKYCKTKINQRMRKYYKTQETTDQKIQQKQKEDIREYFDVDNLGYDLKELLIIILAGIILIFVLDLLVKIGKKMKI